MAFCRHARRWTRGWLALLMATSGVLVAPFARANDAVMTAANPSSARAHTTPPTGKVELHWTAPVGCPDGATVLGQVRSLAPREPDEPIDASAKVWVDERGRWRVALVTESAGVRGERIIDAETCTLAADATTFVLAMMIDPEAVRARLTGTPNDKAPEAAPPPKAPAADAPAAPARTRESGTESPKPPLDPRFGLAALASVDSAVLPSAGIGFGGALSARVFPWNDRVTRLRVRAEASFRYFPAVHATSSVEPSRGADLRLATGQTTLFASWELGPLAIGPSLGLEVGALTGDGRGVTQPVHGSSLWLAALPGTFARWPARAPLAARAQVEVPIPLGRSEFVLSNEILHQSAPSVRASIAADFRF
ncbi:hypothetical protein AKJ09_09440 [Labilithrix luteola]|uniref:Uncharacterized protein n=1 Tax=Labilithrix luteola TaxID=1391654 RepID=A0A0K1QAU2_9BACT|nr:hypothetical protein [Labilithrix luteola]AKV02777.1 hypothetical protein AKJ09_09440 [Labilithrix luteola]